MTLDPGLSEILLLIGWGSSLIFTWARARGKIGSLQKTISGVDKSLSDLENDIENLQKALYDKDKEIAVWQQRQVDHEDKDDRSHETQQEQIEMIRLRLHDLSNKLHILMGKNSVEIKEIEP